MVMNMLQDKLVIKQETTCKKGPYCTLFMQLIQLYKSLHCYYQCDGFPRQTQSSNNPSQDTTWQLSEHYERS